MNNLMIYVLSLIGKSDPSWRRKCHDGCQRKQSEKTAGDPEVRAETLWGLLSPVSHPRSWLADLSVCRMILKSDGIIPPPPSAPAPQPPPSPDLVDVKSRAAAWSAWTNEQYEGELCHLLEAPVTCGSNLLVLTASQKKFGLKWEEFKRLVSQSIWDYLWPAASSSHGFCFCFVLLFSFWQWKQQILSFVLFF